LILNENKLNEELDTDNIHSKMNQDKRIAEVVKNLSIGFTLDGGEVDYIKKGKTFFMKFKLELDTAFVGKNADGKNCAYIRIFPVQEKGCCATCAISQSPHNVSFLHNDETSGRKGKALEVETPILKEHVHIITASTYPLSDTRVMQTRAIFPQIVCGIVDNLNSVFFSDCHIIVKKESFDIPELKIIKDDTSSKLKMEQEVTIWIVRKDNRIEII
jgi:hypothetical protein